MVKYAITYDVGTTGLKTCIFRLDNKITLIASSAMPYPLYTYPDGGAEQDTEDWWRAMCVTTKEVFKKCKIKKEQIEGISFCSQAQGLVLVDDKGNAIRRPMSYMDQRAKKEIERGMAYGLKIGGGNIFKVLPSLRITSAASLSVKDPMWKYKWVQAHEPDNFAKVHKWLDVKDYIICRCTGNFVATQDDAFATLLYDNRKGKQCWSKKLCKIFKINMRHLPKVVKSTDCVGTLRAKQARELGLVEGIKVFGGGGDNSLIGIGAGCTKPGDTHIYVGTSGWVSTLTHKRTVDINSMIATISSAEEGVYNYFAEMETAGKCFDWVINHLALDEIDIYLKKVHVAQTPESQFSTLYEFLHHAVKDVPPGSNGVIFTPWLHGNRCPFEDPNAAGTFIGIKINTGKRAMIRSVLEGIIYHLRWMLECADNKVVSNDVIKFVGGGAISSFSCQLVANIIGRKILTIKNPQNVGAVGAAGIVGVGLGIIPTIEDIAKFIPYDKTYIPDNKIHEQYEPYYVTFKNIYKTNKKTYNALATKTAKDRTKQKREALRVFKFVLFSLSAGLIQLISNAILVAALPNEKVFAGTASIAYFVALILSVLWNFTFNRKFTFKSSNNVPKAMGLTFLFYLFFAPASLFLQAYLCTGNILSLYDLPTHLGLPSIVGTIVCMIANFILEFLYQRFVVFRKSIDTNKSK